MLLSAGWAHPRKHQKVHVLLHDKPGPRSAFYVAAWGAKYLTYDSLDPLEMESQIPQPYSKP